MYGVRIDDDKIAARQRKRLRIDDKFSLTVKDV